MNTKVVKIWPFLYLKDGESTIVQIFKRTIFVREGNCWILTFFKKKHGRT